jgi:MipA family protein
VLCTLRRGITVIAVLSAAFAAAARAEPLPLWELGIGLGGLTAPDYRGSDETRGYLLPLPYIVYRGEILNVDRSGIYGRLFEGERVNLDISFDAGVPVDSDKNAARAGMPDLDPTFEVGPSLEICLWNDCTADRVLQLRLPARAVFSTDFSRVDSRGWVFNPNINVDINNIGPGGGWNFGVAVGLVYADEKHHDYYYQVDPAFATAARPAYDARGGYSGTRVVAALSKRYDGLWLGLFARYDDLSGAEFRDSPLVRVERWFMAGFGVAWLFARSDTLVERDR